jgi:hypothetical protein
MMVLMSGDAEFFHRLWIQAARLSRGSRYRALWLPTVASISGGALWSIFPGPLGFLFLVVTKLTILVWWMVGVTKISIVVLHRQWSILAGRFFVFIVSIPIIYAGFACGDYIHLVTFYPFYWQRIDGKAVGPVRFPWGDEAVSVLDGLQFHTLVYDGSGSTKVGFGADSKYFEALRTSTRHLIGNFYIEEVRSR